MCVVFHENEKFVFRKTLRFARWVWKARWVDL